MLIFFHIASTYFFFVYMYIINNNNSQISVEMFLMPILRRTNENIVICVRVYKNTIIMSLYIINTRRVFWIRPYSFHHHQTTIDSRQYVQNKLGFEPKSLWESITNRNLTTILIFFSYFLNRYRNRYLMSEGSSGFVKFHFFPLHFYTSM